MPTASESALLGGAPLKAAIQGGYTTISDNQSVRFTKYVRLVLPFDGFVFWVKADIVSASAMVNDSMFNEVMVNASPVVEDLAETAAVVGSLHRSVNSRQLEDESISVNRIVFTTQNEIAVLNSVAPGETWIGEIDGQLFAFSSHGKFIHSAGTWHYVGEAIYPAMRSQLIDNVAAFDAMQIIVSNSLPIWLRLNRVMPVYPSFLVDANIVPPYASIHIFPDSTQAIQSAPIYDCTNSQWQLVRERVRVTVYGLNSNLAHDYIRYVQEAAASGIMGISNMPVPRDEKRTQNELTILAQKKTIEFDVNYYQARAREEAVKYILSCVPNFIVA